MDYPPGRFQANLGQPSEPAEVAPESVDLLQMVPDMGRLSNYPDDTMPTTQETPRRMRVVLVQGEQNTVNEDLTDLRRSREAVDTPDPTLAHAHICQTCSRDGGIYYNRQGEFRHGECRSLHAPDTTRDGSVYFNYLQLANRPRTCTLPNQRLLSSGSGYEPIYGGSSVERDNRDNNKKLKTPKPPKPPKPPKTSTLSKNKDSNSSSNNGDTSNSSCKNFVFNCCKSTNVPSSDNGLNAKDKCKSMDDGLYGSSPYHHRPPSPSPDSSPAILNNNRARKVSEWSRVKRLLFLVGILLGILVALGGIVVGFIVLAPHKNKALSCGAPTPVYCDDIGCVHVTAVCLGFISCPNVIKSQLCRQNDSTPTYPAGQQEMENNPMEVVTMVPNFEQPVKDEAGWVYFSQGSGPDKGSKYTILNRAMLFSAAQQECHSKGGHLPFVTSLREQIFLEDYLAQEFMNPDIQRDAIGFWLGARRARGSHSGTCLYKQWKWVDMYGRSHGVVNGFTAFGIDKPDNYFNPEECLYLSYTDDKPENFLKWDDVPCDIPTLGSIKVICEVDDKN